MTLKKENGSPLIIKQKEDFERKFRERELEQELADVKAKLQLSYKELDIVRKQAPSLKVERIETPVRTEIIYEKVRK
jgi:hypothetical protein